MIITTQPAGRDGMWPGKLPLMRHTRNSFGKMGKTGTMQKKTLNVMTQNYRASGWAFIQKRPWAIFRYPGPADLPANE